MQGDGREGEGTPEKGKKGEFLLSFVRHHRQGKVLAHEVELIGEAVGPGEVDGGFVVMTPLHCKAQKVTDDNSSTLILGL